jgi:hypothetical protein
MTLDFKGFCGHAKNASPGVVNNMGKGVIKELSRASFPFFFRPWWLTEQ